MATTYIYTLSGGITIEVTDNIGPINEWNEVGDSGKLLVNGGTLNSNVPPKVCTDKGQVVLTLHDASWDSEVGDTGRATVIASQNTPTNQTWRLTRKS